MGSFSVGVNGAGMSGWVDYSLSDSSSGNYTDVSATYYAHKNSGYSTTYGTFSGYITIDGTQTSWSGSVSVGANSTVAIMSASKRVYHNADGSKTLTMSADGSVGGTSWTTGYGDTSVGLTDFSFPPGTPAAPSLSRSGDGTSVTVTSAIPSSAVTISDYNYRYSYDGSNFTAAQAMGTGRVASFSLPSTQFVYVQTRAYSSEGWGSWSASATIAALPSAPASISVSRSIRNVTVTAGASPSNNGSNITGYFVQSSVDGSTWTTAQPMTSQSYTYANMNPGVSYFFRVYCVNGMGSSATTATSSSLFVPASGRRFDGTDFIIAETAKRWNGSAWVDISTAKRFTGTEWVNLT